MSKRQNGEGTIRQRSDGRWEARYSCVHPETGESKNASVYGSTARQARDRRKEALERLANGAPPKDSEITVATWVQRWMDSSMQASPRKDSTKALYRVLAKHILSEPLGPIKLSKLRATDVERFVVHLQAKVGMRRTGTDAAGKPTHVALSPSTVQRIFVLLRMALDGAVRDGLLGRNAARLVKQPSVPKKESTFLTAEQVRAILLDARASRAWPVLSLIAATGLRRGEALALTWEDVDFQQDAIRVRKTLSRVNGAIVVTQPKTQKSRRNLPMTDALAALLREHKAEQNVERLRAGNQWQSLNLVYCTELGAPADPRNILRAIQRSARRLGIQEPVGIHSLRHSAATSMIEAGVNLKAVSDLLGHTDIRMTANTYGHVTDSAARSAMEALSSAMGV